MRTMKTLFTIAVAATMPLGLLAGCGGSQASSDNGRVYYLNKKSEQQDYWKDLAQKYQDETGVPVEIETSGTDYDSSLSSELAKSQPVTMFQADGPSFMQGFEKYAADMSDTKIYKSLDDSHKNASLTNKDGKPIAIPWTVESYGIIYNKSLLNKYFKSSWATVKSVKNIDNFKALKTVADEIQKHKSDLGVQGAFSSAGMDDTSGFRFDFQMPTTPVYYELKDKGADLTKTPESLDGTYVKYMKNLYDIYLQDSTVDPSSISGKTMDDSTADFATGQSVFFQDGEWIYNELKDQDVKDSDLGVLPLYMGIPGEKKQGLNEVTSNYWCVNAKASAKDQAATKKFIDWLVTSDEGRKAISQDMGQVTPFKTFSAKKYQVHNALVEASRESKKVGKQPVIQIPNPSHQWEKNLGAAELRYAQGQGSWDDVIKVFTQDWTKEYKLSYNK